jgi:hypothetical protein
MEKKIYEVIEKYRVRDMANGLSKNTDIILNKYGIEHFRIKNWKEERGAKVHPLLKDSPVADLGMRYYDKLKPLEKEIDDIFDKAGPDEKSPNFSDENDKVTFYIYNNVSPELRQKLMKIFAEDLGIKEFLAFHFIENVVNFTEIPGAPGEYPTQIWPAVDWHEDGQVYNCLRMAIYLNDVDDIEDGAFEYAYPPENYVFDFDTLHDLDVDFGAGTRSYSHKFAPEENKKLLLGKKFTSALFHPHIPHKGNYPKRKNRRVIFIDFEPHNRFSKANEYADDIGGLDPDLHKPREDNILADSKYSPNINK